MALWGPITLLSNWYEYGWIVEIFQEKCKEKVNSGVTEPHTFNALN